MTSVSYHIANLLEKMGSSDKDYRFMATNDLMQELQKDSIKLDDDSERKVARMLLKLLEDKNGEVQNLAVKCLGPLVNKVKEFQVEAIVDTLCSNMVSDKEQLRDISSIGLKTVISELPPASSALAVSVCKKIVGRLTAAIAKQDDVSVQLEALDILGDLLCRFGSILLQFHPSIQVALLPQLASSRLAVRKRSIVALGYLVQSSSSPLFRELLEILLEELRKNSGPSTTRTYIQCVAAISRSAGHRVGDYLTYLVPLIVRFCRQEDDELREYCIQACEAFVKRCPKDVSEFVPQIQQLCLEFLTYDPNYNYDDDDEQDDESMETDDDEDDDDEDYSDDDDMSWKVRRAAAKCLEAIISTRHDLLADMYRLVSRHLVARFKEREENVKADIFHAYVALLKQTKASSPPDVDAMEESESPTALLQAQVPDLVKAVQRLMKDKSLKTRQGCNALLSSLVSVLPGALSNHVSGLIPGIQFSLGDKNSSSNMKIDTLSFLHSFMATHPPAVIQPHVNVLVPLVVTAVGDPFYKITSEALLVTQQLVKVIRPFDQSQAVHNPRPYVNELYQATIVRMKAADIDQEVKERAIAAMGQLFANCGDMLVDELRVCAPIFLDRLRNEITRLTTVKALTKIASSPLKVDLTPLLREALPILGSFLRKNMRALKLSTLTGLITFVKAYGSALTALLLQEVVKELAPLISESDLHVSQLALTLLLSICRVEPHAMGSILDSNILQQILLLVQSALLQGQALQALLDLLQALSHSGVPQLSFNNLMQMLMKPAMEGPALMHKQAYHSTAKCLAALVRASPKEGPGVLKNLMVQLKGARSDSVKLLSLLTLGEIGTTVDLSGLADLTPAIMECFASPNEEVKSSASYALGNIAIGNLEKFVPFVLNEIHTQQRRQYLLLHSLKEIITHLSSSPEDVAVLKPYIGQIWELLQKHSDCPEEGTRNVVAECLGRLTLVDPTTLLPKLKACLKHPSPLCRGAAVTAVKYTIADHPQPIDSLLRTEIGHFLHTLQDADLSVRQVALVTLNSAAHNKPVLIRDRLASLLPHLYNETKIRPELIREVEMGPFKHTVDDGLDLRKAAFECMYTLLDTCLERVDVFEFLTHVESGLKDHYDIKMLTDLMVARLAVLKPAPVLQRMDRLVEPLKATCSTRVKANSVKQEFEKQDELKRSALRAFAALLAVPDADRCPQVSEFLGQIRAGDLSSMFEAVQREQSSHGSGTERSISMDTS